MKNPILITMLMGAGFLVLFTIGELMYHKYKIKAEYTRKFAHLTVGILALFFPLVFISHWQVLILTLLFFLILILAKKTNQLKHIHAVPRVTYGSYLYPPTVYACFILSEAMEQNVFFYLPILVMAVSDPVAAITGSNWGKKISKQEHSKTFLGSLMFLLSAIIASLTIYFNISDISFPTLLLISFLVGIVGMIAEVISYKGWDNFTIPLAIVILLLILRYYSII